VSKSVSYVCHKKTAKLMSSLGEELKYVSENSDTWLGFAVWSVSQLRLPACWSFKLMPRLEVSTRATN
jgi:hypothetical protein